ncbi:hypothetical protein [Pulveribacter suum]|uniref:hypothetical protein n=1 Tax=Pulveribacter suum TaxID=2116657 RepID=UPI0013009248|nr:hypothetical protein [Pulveribacter suum]
MTTADSINLAIAIIGGCSVLVSALVAIITLKIARANRESADIMRAQHESSTRPYIEIAPMTAEEHSVLLLRVRNSGTSSARNVILTLDQDFYFNAEESETHNLRNYTAFSQPIASVPPRCEITFILGVGHTVFSHKDRCPLTFNISARYEFANRQVTEINPIDLQPFAKVAMIKSPYLEQLEKMNAQLKILATALVKSDA